MQSASSPPAQSPAVASTPYPLPASPTLTNPDMILPDYDDTPSSPDRSQSPLIMWKNAHAGDMPFQLPGQAFSAPITPTTPIIYGNGTMLSDIGEVTEVESTCPPTRSRASSTREDFRLRTSATPQTTTRRKDPKFSRERRASVESTSTITDGDRPGVFADFDDTVSVDDSNFQGDDEESVADSYIDDASVQESISPAGELPKGFGDERYSTALSRRAEHILANAKRRLSTMEGNLSRARTSLSSPTWSGTSAESTPSPPIIRPATAIHHDSSSRISVYGHSRISSENNVPSDIKTTTIFTPRSSSAMGAAGGYRQPFSPASQTQDETPKASPKGNSVYGNAAFAKSKPSLHGRDHTLETLSEDEISQPIETERPSLESARLDSFLSPTFGSFSEQGLRRSASTAQMRDLKDQMKDLKGRLSTLRDQARADSMKRRSLQSLRTPSPFTHARVEQWYADTKGAVDDPNLPSEDATSHALDEEAPSVVEESQKVSGIHGTLEIDEESVVSDQPDLKSPLATELSPSPLPNVPPVSTANDEVADDMKTEDGFDDNENDDGDEFEEADSESGASSYHDSVQVQLSHEDREDAFDYEHFFLHSAMGSMSQRRVGKRGSRDSFSSEDSVETTRGPSLNPRSSWVTAKSRTRRGSDGSVSSAASFATATEGRNTRADHQVDGEYQERTVALPERVRSRTPETARRTAFNVRDSSSSSGSDQSRRSRKMMVSETRVSYSSTMHRPSVSSFDSAGTTRSFPLVNRPGSATAKMNGGGILTPRDSPDLKKQISETLLDEAASICGGVGSKNGINGNKDNGDVDEGTGSIDALSKEDQILVQRLVASLGHCVLGLTEAGRASTESRVLRRRIDAARRILEGADE
ncbi:hypothetical protein F4778DRAFT_87244 [Xylariomycetidae sp. FL2044]|nr:hypothetical protein F4778DRAFT_87244 [Xylariomycetidae sp. FL2044]